MSKDTQKDKHSSFFIVAFLKGRARTIQPGAGNGVSKEETGDLGQRLPGPLPQSQLQRGARGFREPQEPSLAWETLNLWERPGHHPEGLNLLELWLELAWFADPHAVPWEGATGRHGRQSQGWREGNTIRIHF